MGISSLVLRTTFGADLRASASSFNDLVPLKAVPQSPEATQNQPHNFAVNHIEAGTTAAERGKWYCTICHKGPFKGKPGWKKHEEKKHFPNFTAFCQPNIGMDGRIITCSICNVENPECRHFASCRGAECATKKLSDRKYLTKESFICHLQTEHLLPSHSPQVEEWQRTPPRHVWACGFCADWSINGIEDRFRHIARHYETDCTIADWKHSDVTYKLLYQPYILSEWFEQCRSRFAPQTHPGEWPDIFWSDDEAKALQERLTAGQEEDARKLAEDAFNASQIGKQMQWRQQHQQHQQHPQHQQHQQHQQLHLQLHHQYQYQQRQKHQQQQEHQKRQQQERDTLVLGISQQWALCEKSLCFSMQSTRKSSRTLISPWTMLLAPPPLFPASTTPGSIATQKNALSSRWIVVAAKWRALQKLTDCRRWSPRLSPHSLLRSLIDAITFAPLTNNFFGPR